MKKTLMAATALTGLLASCGSQIIIEPLPNQRVTINSVNSFTSDWYYLEGNTTRYVICRDRATEVRFDVSWSGPLSRLEATFEGATSGAKLTKTTPVFAADTSGNRVFTYSFGAGMAPQSLTKGAGDAKLKAQAIIVNPSNPATTFLTVRGFNPADIASNALQAPMGIPVVTCGV